jgi:hypothetical protein
MSRGITSWASGSLVLAVLLADACHHGTTPEKPATDQSVVTAKKAAVDAMAEYQVAKLGKHIVEACLSAGKVSESFLRAKDEAQYKMWKQREETDCKYIGFPF